MSFPYFLNCPLENFFGLAAGKCCGRWSCRRPKHRSRSKCHQHWSDHLNSPKLKRWCKIAPEKNDLRCLGLPCFGLSTVLTYNIPRTKNSKKTHRCSPNNSYSWTQASGSGLLNWDLQQLNWRNLRKHFSINPAMRFKGWIVFFWKNGCHSVVRFHVLLHSRKQGFCRETRVHRTWDWQLLLDMCACPHAMPAMPAIWIRGWIALIWTAIENTRKFIIGILLTWLIS